MLVYYLLFFLFLCMALLEDKLTRESKVQLLILSGVFLVFFSGLRSREVGSDYKTYEMLYKSVQEFSILFYTPSNFFNNYRLEPSFILISSLAKTYLGDGIKIVFFVYALLGVTLKIKAVKEISDYKLLSLLIYFSSVFFLHDMNQVRAGVAIGVLLLSIPSIVENNFKRFVSFLLIAIFFHYSSIIFLLFYFLNTKKINQIVWLFVLIVPIVMCLLKFDIISILSKFEFGVFSEKVRAYSELQKTTHNRINIFNFGVLIQIVVSLFFIVNAGKSKNRYVVILTKISCFGVAFFYLFSSVPILAFREFELLSCVQIFLIPLSIDLIRPKAFAQSVILLISFLYFINQLVVNSIFSSYSTFLFN